MDRSYWNNTIDTQYGTLYSRLLIPAGQTATSYRLFADRVGSGHTFTDTNMLMPNMLPAPDSFALRALTFFFVPGPDPGSKPASQIRLLRNYVLELQLGSKVYFRIPLAMFPQRGELGRALQDLRALVNLESRRVAPIDREALDALLLQAPHVIVWPHDTPLVILPQMYFQVELRGTSTLLSEDLDLYVVMLGYHTRGVQ